MPTSASAANTALNRLVSGETLRRGVEALGDLRNFGRCDEEHNGRRIDKAADQPWASNAVDLRLLARHPDGAAASVAFRNLVGVNGRELRLLPGDLAAFENLG